MTDQAVGRQSVTDQAVGQQSVTDQAIGQQSVTDQAVGQQSPAAQGFPLMHPVTRLGRVIQQLKSFGGLHAVELEGMAQDLDAAGATEIATRLRIYREVQRDEAQIVIDELVDIQTDLSASPLTVPQQQPGVPMPPPPVAGEPYDPAINSPKRAKWLAEQAAEAERLKQPFNRRDFFGRGSRNES